MTTNPRDLESRVAVIESKVSDLQQEMQRSRSRLHQLEADRAALNMLTTHVRDLATSMKEITVNAREIATEAAQQAFRVAREHEDELGRGRYLARLQSAGVGAALFGAGWLVLEKFVG